MMRTARVLGAFIRMTHPYFAEPNVTALCAEILHAIQCELSQVARVFAATGDQWEWNVSVEKFSVVARV